jgi:hypothetical protein
MILGARCLARVSQLRSLSLYNRLPVPKSSFISSLTRGGASKATTLAANATSGSGSTTAAVAAASSAATTMARPDHSSLSNSQEVVVRHSHFGALYGLAVQHSRCITRHGYSLLCRRSVHTLLLCKMFLLILKLYNLNRLC